METPRNQKSIVFACFSSQQRKFGMQFVKPTPRCNVVKIYELKIKIHDAKQGTLYVTKYYKVIKGYIID